MDRTSAFEAYLEDRLQIQKDRFPAPLWNSVRYSVFSGGKRIRPRLIFASGLALGLSDRELFPLAALVEFIHTYTLIHDDLPAMDDDDFRRGKPTNHKLFGEATALLAGDALTPLALQELFKLPVSDTVRMRLLSIVLESIDGGELIGGQVAEFELNAPTSLAALESIFSRKTGALFGLCLMLTSVASEKTADFTRELGAIGRQIGILFQLADDLEDDWNEKSLDFAHIASIASRTDVEQLAKKQLQDLRKKLERLPLELRSSLEPFVEEIAKKCENA